MNLDMSGPNGTDDLTQVVPSHISQPEIVCQLLVEELKTPIAIMLGMLLIIPLKERQRERELFEACFALNGHDEDGLVFVSRRWNLQGNQAHLIIKRLWQKLKIAGSPIVSPIHLLEQISRLKRIAGKSVVVRPTPFSYIEQREILARFKQKKNPRLPSAPAEQFELMLFAVSSHSKRQEALVLATCVFFEVTVSDLRRSQKVQGQKRFYSKAVTHARRILAFLLHNDLNVNFARIGELVGRSANHIKFEVQNIRIEESRKDVVVLEELESVRKLWRCRVAQV